jgi:hypothetical protein
MLSVGARALFGELQGLFYVEVEGYVFLSARDGAERLRTRPHNILRWFDELEHYGFLVKLCGAHLGSDGEGQSAHYRLTDRYFHNKPPTRDFEKWSGEVFSPKKRTYSDAEKARLSGLKKQNPVTRSDTPRDTVGHIRAGAKKPEKGNKCDTAVHISSPPKCDTVDHVSSITTRTRPSEGSADPNFNPILSWLCLRAVYHQEMNKICDEIANIGESA